MDGTGARVVCGRARWPPLGELEAARPSDIRILFVGESPPAGGDFFYLGNSRLHGATRDAFHADLPRLVGSASFLRAFADLGCYLDDLCTEPVNQWGIADPRRIAARVAGEGPLAARLKQVSPRAIIVVMKAVVPHVRRAIESAGIAAARELALPFPIRPAHRERFVKELSEELRHFERAGYFITPSVG